MQNLGGNIEDNTKTEDARTDDNTAPNISPDIISMTTYTGVTIDAIDFNDSNTNSDIDDDGDLISYVCYFDQVNDSSVDESTAALCSTISGENGNLDFNQFTGIFSSWTPDHSIVSGNPFFEFKIIVTDPYGANDSIVFSTTVQPGIPLITPVDDYFFPAEELLQNEVVSLDLNNIRFPPSNDTDMTYTCTFVMNIVGSSTAPQTCTGLPGSSSIDASTGVFSWTPDATAFGSFDINFTGTNPAGSHSRTATWYVRSEYSEIDIIAAFDAKAADLSKPGVNSPGTFTSEFKNLISGGMGGTLSNFNQTIAWQGSNTPASPIHLNFDGVDSQIEFGTDLNSDSSLSFSAWLNPTSYDGGQTILTYADEDNGLLLRTANDGSGQIELGIGINDSYEQLILASSPVAYWRLDETSGTTADNLGTGGSQLDGTYVNSPEQGAIGPGTIGNYATGFTESSQQYVTTANNTNDLNSIESNTITVEAWVRNKTRYWSADHTLVSKRNQFILSVDDHTTNRNFGFYIRTTNNAWRRVKFNIRQTYNIMDWNHYVGRYDGSQLCIFINGQQVNCVNQTEIIQDEGGSIMIGRDDGSNRYADAYIDEVAIYESALSNETILDHYNAAKSRCRVKLPKDQWHHLGGSFDNTTKELAMYSNGEKLCSQTLSTATLNGSPNNLKIGRDTNDANPWEGKLASVKFYSAIHNHSNDYEITKNQFDRPLEVTGDLQLWLKADVGITTAAGGAVTSWEDQSGNEVTLTEDTNTPEVQAASLNGLDVVRFDGSQYLSSNDNLKMQTAIIVFRQISSLHGAETRGQLIGNWEHNASITIDSSSGNDNGFTFGGDENQSAAYKLDDGDFTSLVTTDNSQQWNDDTWHLLVVEYDIPIRSSRIDIGFLGPDYDAGVQEYFGGEIAEILVFSRTLSSDETLNISNYLKSKWGL